MAKAPLDIRSLARAHTKLCIRTLAGIAKSSTNDSAKVAAAQALLDRGYGKCAQILAGDEDGGALVVNIIHRVRDETMLRQVIQPDAQRAGLLLAPSEDE